jgi:anti-sigma regulatory factor (Ser/Thr protein kinase)
VRTVETTIANRRDDLARVTRIVEDLAATHHLARDVVADVNVALDEVLTNILTYGYDDDEIHEIRIRLSLDQEVIEVEVEDDGRPYDPTALAPPDLSAPLRDRPVGGLGMHFVRNLMSEVTYARAGDHNRLLLKKCLAHQSEADEHGSS